MEKTSSFLFSGIHFDRKKFATDFARFKEIDDLMEDLNSVEHRKPESEDVEKEGREKVRVKKRKTKTMCSEKVEGFSVFKSLKLEKPVAKEENEQPENKLSLEKKKFYQQLERDALFQKKYNIHVSGNNIPSPLRDFAELSSRYGCKAKL